MRAVTTTIARVAYRLRTAALAAALAFASNGAYASFASSVIDSIFVSGTSADSFLFAPTDVQSRGWDLSVYQNLVLQPGSKTKTFTDWTTLPLDATASTTQANARISTTTSDFGFFQTPSFSLSASANHLANGILYDALGQGSLGGSFCFWDPNTNFDGTSASCTGSGDLVFQLFYTLTTNTLFPGPNNFAYADMSLDAFGGTGGSFSDFDTASTLPAFPVSHSGSFEYDTTLSASDALGFQVVGNVEAKAAPEPGVLSLVALGLIGLAATRRRSARAVS